MADFELILLFKIPIGTRKYVSIRIANMEMRLKKFRLSRSRPTRFRIITLSSPVVQALCSDQCLHWWNMCKPSLPRVGQGKARKQYSPTQHLQHTGYLFPWPQWPHDFSYWVNEAKISSVKPSLRLKLNNKTHGSKATSSVPSNEFPTRFQWTTATDMHQTLPDDSRFISMSLNTTPICTKKSKRNF
jgi:hypothetical protein